MGHQFNIRFKDARDEYIDTDLFTDTQPFPTTSLLSSFVVRYDDLSDGLWVHITYVTPAGVEAQDGEGDVSECAQGERYRYQVVDKQDIEGLDWVKHNRKMVIFDHGGELVNGVKLQTVAGAYFSDDRLEDVRPVIADLFAIMKKEMELELNGEAAPVDEEEVFARAAARMGIPVGVLKDTVALYEALDAGDGPLGAFVPYEEGGDGEDGE